MQAAVPELLEENSRSLELWELVHDQIRRGPNGFYVLDVGAVATVFKAIDDIDDLEFELVKMKYIFAFFNPRTDEKRPGKKEMKTKTELE